MARVLACDDDATALMVVRAALEAAGHTALTTGDPQSAVEIAVSMHVDAVVLDVVMPDVNGYEVLRGIRHHPAVDKLPVLMLSSLGERHDRVRGLKEGADDYLTKPFDPEELVLRIERLVERAEAWRAHLHGSLEHFSIPELLQQLEQGRKTGTLYVNGGGLQGAVGVVDGWVSGAALRELRGKDACFALLELGQGRFRFEPGAPAGALDGLEEGGISVQHLVLEHARLLDELCHHEVVAPGARLWAMPEGGPMPRLPEDHPALPLAELWTAVADRPGAALEELLRTPLAAPHVIEAALAVLVQEGAVRAEEPVDYDQEMVSIGDELRAASQIDPVAAAVEAVLRGATACGIAPSLVPLALVVGRGAASDVVELVKDLPRAGSIDVPDSLGELLRSGRGASVRLRQNVGTVVCNVLQLEGSRSRQRIEGLLPDCAAVVLWPRGETSAVGFEWIVPQVEGLESTRLGLLIASAEGEGAALTPLVDGCRRWTVVGAEPTSFSGLLRVVAEGLFAKA